jgi:DcuC family C4-dicarboxylate transporter
MILFLISLAFIVLTAICLFKHLNSQGVLLTAGLLMCIVAMLFGNSDLGLKSPTGSVVFDFIKLIEETFVSNIGRAGLMIMTIGGYVAYMNYIHATDTLVRISMKPLRWMKKCPMLAAILTIPIGQMLFITTPSATGMGLLLVASVYPILISLGVSKLTALSVIAATTIFDQGPGSANTAMAAELIGINNVEYFLRFQLPLALPTTCIVMLVFFLSNTYFDRKDKEKRPAAEDGAVQPKEETADEKKCPGYFALFPILPLALLVIFSPYVGLFAEPVTLNTTNAMFFSLFVTLVFEAIYTKSIKETFKAFGEFWKGMGKVFANVVTLIVASQIFSKGLIQLKFIDNLVTYSTGVGLSGSLIIVVFILVIFLAAILMGSGNAAFFSFGPLMPGIATRLGMPVYSAVLPTQLASSMGRAASPISGVNVSIAGVVGASPMDLAKRNIVPLTVSVVFLTLFHLISI